MQEHTENTGLGSDMGASANKANGGDGAITDMLDGILDDVPTSAAPHERTEGTLARMIESQT